MKTLDEFLKQCTFTSVMSYVTCTEHRDLIKLGIEALTELKPWQQVGICKTYALKYH